MKEKKEIDEMISKLVEKELEIGEAHDQVCDEFNKESDPLKQAMLLIDKVIPIEIRTVLLMNSVDALNWVRSPNHPTMQELLNDALSATKGNTEVIKNNLKMLREIIEELSKKQKRS